MYYGDYSLSIFFILKENKLCGCSDRTTVHVKKLRTEAIQRQKKWIQTTRKPVSKITQDTFLSLGYLGVHAATTIQSKISHDNRENGILATFGSTTHLHGEATAIHSNTRLGIFAYSAGKVIIHLPSHHNTSYNN